jgi:hypothetical protein
MNTIDNKAYRFGFVAAAVAAAIPFLMQVTLTAAPLAASAA